MFFLDSENKLVLPGLRGCKKRKKKILGRGPGSGKGRQSGRGHKGQGQRGTLPRDGFEGGQFPFYLSVSKRGFHNYDKPVYSIIQLSKLQYFIENNRLDATCLITTESLLKCGIVKRLKDGVKVLARGADSFNMKINIAVSKVTPKASEIIEKNNGTVITTYHSRNHLKYLEFVCRRPFDPRALVLKKSHFALPKTIYLPSPVDPIHHTKLNRKTDSYEIISEVEDEPITCNHKVCKKVPKVMFERPPLHLLGYYSSLRKRGILSGYGGSSIPCKDLDSY